jgi:hypothetical protein
MPTDQHEAMIRTYIEDVFNRHNLDNLGDYMSDDLVSHWLGDRTVQGLPAEESHGRLLHRLSRRGLYIG